MFSPGKKKMTWHWWTFQYFPFINFNCIYWGVFVFLEFVKRWVIRHFRQPINIFLVKAVWFYISSFNISMFIVLSCLFFFHFYISTLAFLAYSTKTIGVKSRCYRHRFGLCVGFNEKKMQTKYFKNQISWY